MVEFLEKDTISKEIVINALRGSLVPFIGAGFSNPFGTQVGEIELLV